MVQEAPVSEQWLTLLPKRSGAHPLQVVYRWRYDTRSELAPADGPNS